MAQFRHHTFLVQAGCFGSAADQGIGGPDQDVMSLKQRIRHVFDHNFLQSLSKHLFHVLDVPTQDGFEVPASSSAIHVPFNWGTGELRSWGGRKCCCSAARLAGPLEVGELKDWRAGALENSPVPQFPSSPVELFRNHRRVARGGPGSSVEIGRRTEHYLIDIQPILSGLDSDGLR
jgi:hypothetical protein